MIERAQFAPIIAMVAALYPRQFKADAVTISAYYSILCDLPIELLKAAVLHICGENREWPPAAGVIRSTAFSLVEHSEGAITAGEAWQEARAALGDPMKYYPGISAPTAGDFSDPAVYATVQAIGAADIAHGTTDMIHATRARFMDTFSIIKARQRTTKTMLPAVRETMARIAPGRCVPQIENRMKELETKMTTRQIKENRR